MCQQKELNHPHSMHGCCHTPWVDFGRSFTGEEPLAELEEYLNDLRSEIKEVEKLIDNFKK